MINGKDSQYIHGQDRGLQYGDGHFTTLAVYNHQPLLWPAHYQRLCDASEQLDIPVPNKNQLESDIAQLIQQQNNKNPYVLKIIITRGEGGRGYQGPAKVTPTRILTTYPWPQRPAENKTKGVIVRLCDTPISQHPKLAGIKHLNRLEQVLARSEWSDNDISEGLLTDLDGHVISGTFTNLFMIKDNKLITPDLSLSGINGVMRQTILQAAKTLDIPIAIKNISLTELHVAQALFLCNSIIGIWPIRRLAETTYPVDELVIRLQQYLYSQGAVVA